MCVSVPVYYVKINMPYCICKAFKIKRNKKSNTKAHYVTNGRLYQLERHCDFLDQLQ